MFTNFPQAAYSRKTNTNIQNAYNSFILQRTADPLSGRGLSPQWSTYDRELLDEVTWKGLFSVVSIPRSVVSRSDLHKICLYVHSKLWMSDMYVSTVILKNDEAFLKTNQWHRSRLVHWWSSGRCNMRRRVVESPNATATAPLKRLLDAFLLPDIQ